MSQNVSCPKCGHVFEVDAEFEKCEKIVAEIVGGKCAPPRTAGYDVIDPGGKTYQVKHTNRSYETNWPGNFQWVWMFGNGNKLQSDFLVLFAKDTEEMFLLDHAISDHHTKPWGKGNFAIRASTGNGGWIRNYHVTSETFIQKRDELLRAQQLRLEIESQYAL